MAQAYARLAVRSTPSSACMSPTCRWRREPARRSSAAVASMAWWLTAGARLGCGVRSSMRRPARSSATRDSGCGVLGVFDHDLQAWKGVMQSYYVDEKLRDGILVEATYPPPGVGYSAGGVGGKGSDLKDFLARYRQTAAAGLIISDSGTGRVRLAPGGGLLITYDLHADDLRKTLEGIRLATEIYLAAGATEVHTLLPGLPAVRKQEELSWITEGKWTAADLKLSAYHPMGTCRMGKDSRSSVVDEFGRAHDLAGLVISDASILPGSTYVNPQITIMALAARGARHLAAELS